MSEVLHPPPVRWDILAEHLEEGAMTFERFEDALDAADHTLDEVEDRVEANLLAHLDALLTAGSGAAEQLLGPVLADPTDADPFLLMMAAGVALLTGRWQLLENALWSEDAELRARIVRACALFGDANLDAWIAGAYARSSSAYRPVLLELAAARHLPLASVLTSLQSGSPAELEVAARASLSCDYRTHLGAVEALLEHELLVVREAAIVTALHWGSSRALDHCRALAAAEPTCTPRLLRLLALLGDPRDHGYVVQALNWASSRCHAIRSLGFTGNLASVELLLSLLESADGDEARLASEGLVLITGIDPLDEALVHEIDEDLDPDTTPDLDVPVFEPAAARAWWANAHGQLDASRRNLRGQTDLPSAMLRLLTDGRMRDRGEVALSLAIRTGGRVRIDCRAFTVRQREQLAMCTGLSTTDFCVRHSNW